jgi:fibronectin-binding autotransporter adhesin
VVSLIKADAGTWRLTHANNSFTGLITLSSTTTSAGTLSYASAAGTNPITFAQTTGTAILAYTGAAPLTMSGLITASALTTGTITLDASGVTAADTINYSNAGSLGTAASGIRKLVLSGSNTGANTFAGQWVNNTGAAATLTKNGAGTWVLTGANTYTGPTTVSAGKLFINGNQSTATGDVSVSAGATLGGTGTLGGTTTIAATGKLEFNLRTAAAGHDKLELAATKALAFAGASTLTITSSGGASPGDYTLVTAPGGFGASVPPATVNLPTGWTADAPRFVGNDLMLNITASGSGFASWQSANSATGQTLAQDHDHDGVPNGIEWFIKGSNSSTGSTALPGVDTDPGTGALSVTWTKAATYTGSYGADFVVETSADLTGTWNAEASPGTVTLSGNDVKYIFPSPPGAKKFARLKVTGP